MGDRARRLAESVWGAGLKSEPWHEVVAIGQQAPGEIRDLAEMWMDRPPKGSTVYFDAALSYLPESEWDALARLAVRRLEGDPSNEIAAAVVSYGALQCPEALAPELERLFEVDSYFTTYYSTYAWRAAGDGAVPFLADALRSSDPARRERALGALFEIRSPRALATVVDAAPGLGFDDTYVRSCLQLVGFEARGAAFLRLYETEPLHIMFPQNYLARMPAHVMRSEHPTWLVHEPVGTPARFGGSGDGVCPVCGDSDHHLITLDPIPQSAAVTGLDRLHLATCLSCLGWSVPALWYRHAPDGRPTAVEVSEPRKPEFPHEALHETAVQLCNLGRRWRWQDWALSNSRENLHRIGGHPTWIQNADYPECPKCGQTARFLLQLDSELDGGWLWGSGGVLYVFWCDRCKMSGQLWQCT
jgi:hypothetical protein